MMTQYVETKREEIKESQAERKPIVIQNKFYDSMAMTTHNAVKNSLWNSLSSGNPMPNVFELEEKTRFQRLTETMAMMKQNNEKRMAEAQSQVETHRSLKRSRIPILVAYVALVLVVVVAIIATVPGTAWESNTEGMTKISVQRVENVTSAESYANAVTINTIVTEQGPVEVELEPYQKTENNDTNWFDKMCDWLSGVFGG